MNKRTKGLLQFVVGVLMIAGCLAAAQLGQTYYVVGIVFVGLLAVALLETF